MKRKVLITGGSGMIGGGITGMLLKKNYEVIHLTRRGTSRHRVDKRVALCEWDPRAGALDEKAFEGVSSIIHLAGANLNAKRWTAKYKAEIVDSRVNSARLLFDFLSRGTHQVRNFLSASAIGYYGFEKGAILVSEEATAGSDFLSNVVTKWEGEADRFSALRMRVCKVRTGIVLSKVAGALVEIARPIRWGFGAPLGSGRQVMSWIHIDDLCGIYIHLLENEMLTGSYNAVAPAPVTNTELTKAIARILTRPLWLPPVPEFVLRLLVGEVAEVVVNGARISCDKIVSTGYHFMYPRVEPALRAELVRSGKVDKSASP